MVDAVRRRRRRIRRALLFWATTSGRDYRWRHASASPYQVLVAEVLLKRTTARAAARAYPQFLARFPDVASLANAETADLEGALAGVGLYNQRARAFKEMAAHLREQHAGAVPDDLARLSRVPHVGPYTARAVLSFAYGRPAAVVDSNVSRVLGRLFREELGIDPSLSAVQEVADRLLPRREHKAFNWALLDLAALVCRYDRPQCQVCPLVGLCDHAGNEGACR